MTNTKGMETTKQTSVDWLIEELGEYFPWGIGGIEYLIKQAKEIHKEEIIKAANSENSVDINYGEKYYNETYGGGNN
jgi:hypothetical protein